MSAFEERSVELHTALGKLKTNIGDLKVSYETKIVDLKTAYEAKVAAEKARADEAEKKLAAASASAVSLAAFDAWAGQFIEEIKGAMT